MSADGGVQHEAAVNSTLRPPRRPPPRFSSLVDADWRRMRSRRWLRLLTLFAVVGYLIVIPAIGVTQFSRVSPQTLADASARRDALAAEFADRREQCLSAPARSSRAARLTPEQRCPPVLSAEDLGPVEQFLPKQVFVPSVYLGPVLTALLLLTAIALFVVGAHWIGSDIATRVIVTQAIQEPRRTRVFVAKTGLLAVVALGAAVSVVAVWTASAALFTAAFGRNDLTVDQWVSTVAQGGRGAALVLVSAVAGAIGAFLTRSAAGAFGALVGELVVVELLIGSVLPRWQEWLPGVNARALMAPEGVVVSYPQEWIDLDGTLRDTVEVTVSSAHGGIALAGLMTVLVMIAWAVWRRRDLT